MNNNNNYKRLFKQPKKSANSWKKKWKKQNNNSNKKQTNKSNFFQFHWKTMIDSWSSTQWIEEKQIVKINRALYYSCIYLFCCSCFCSQTDWANTIFNIVHCTIELHMCWWWDEAKFKQPFFMTLILQTYFLFQVRNNSDQICLECCLCSSSCCLLNQLIK